MGRHGHRPPYVNRCRSNGSMVKRKALKEMQKVEGGFETVMKSGEFHFIRRHVRGALP